MALPTPGGPAFVTDGGLETDLIFNRGLDLPEFAAFPLLEHERGRDSLRDYYTAYADIARAGGVGLVLASPTWRANPDWAARVGYDARALDRANREAAAFVMALRGEWGDLGAVAISGQIGPRGDGYVSGDAPTPEEAEDYHRGQVESFAGAGVDVIEALTMTTAQEALGVVRAANAVDVPVGILYTVETDGRLPDGTSLREAVERVDDAGDVAYFGVNCAHPTHLAPGLEDGDWLQRIGQIRPNASTLTHAELDEAEELDAGDPAALATDVDVLRDRLPMLSVVGGCCGTDARHVASLWGVAAP
jgi:S-methylmethionine-dependent homocysteine/selenocysteine methylase